MAIQRVQLDGTRTLCVERFGRLEGKPVFYFHGLPGSWLDVLRADALFRDAGLAVLAVDRPGLGGSSFVRRRALLDWPDVAALADRLGLERFAVLGYSNGGK